MGKTLRGVRESSGEFSEFMCLRGEYLVGREIMRLKRDGGRIGTRMRRRKKRKKGRKRRKREDRRGKRPKQN